MIPVCAGLFCAFCLFVLLVPMRVYVVLAVTPEARTVSVHVVSWERLLGLVWRKRGEESWIEGVLLGRSCVWPRRRLEKEEEREREEVAGRGEAFRRVRHILCLANRVLLRFPVLIKRVLKVFTVDGVDVEGCLGTGDPSSTGRVYGFLQVIQAVSCNVCRISVVPDFAGATLEGKAVFALRFVFVRLLWAAFRTGVELGWAYRACRV